MRITLNQKTSEKIYRGEDKTIVVYLYDEDTFEPIDLSSYDEFLLCLPNQDGELVPVLEVVGALTGTAVEGKITFEITSAESAILSEQNNPVTLRLNNTITPSVDIEEFVNNNIEVTDASC